MRLGMETHLVISQFMGKVSEFQNVFIIKIRCVFLSETGDKIPLFFYEIQENVFFRHYLIHSRQCMKQIGKNMVHSLQIGKVLLFITMTFQKEFYG